MKKFNPWGFTIPLLIFVILFWSSPKAFLNINPKWLCFKKDTSIAIVDSTSVIYGIRGFGYNQTVHYSYTYGNQNYNDTYKATAINSGALKVGDKIKLEIMINDPSYHKIVACIKKVNRTKNIKSFKLESR